MSNYIKQVNLKTHSRFNDSDVNHLYNSYEMQNVIYQQYLEYYGKLVFRFKFNKKKSMWSRKNKEAEILKQTTLLNSNRKLLKDFVESGTLINDNLSLEVAKSELMKREQMIAEEQNKKKPYHNASSLNKDISMLEIMLDTLEKVHNFRNVDL